MNSYNSPAARRNMMWMALFLLPFILFFICFAALALSMITSMGSNSDPFESTWFLFWMGTLFVGVPLLFITLFVARVCCIFQMISSGQYPTHAYGRQSTETIHIVRE